MSTTRKIHKISLVVDAQTKELKNVTDQFKTLENEIRRVTGKVDTLGTHMKATEAKMNKSLHSTANASRKAHTSMANDVVRHIRRLESMLVAFYALKKAYDVTIGMGHEFNKMMESEKIGMALIISGRLKHVNVLGEEVSAMDRWIYANHKAKDVMEDVREINVSTPHTLEQTTQIYKTMAGQVLAYGGNLEQVKNATKDVSIVSKAMNVDFGQLLKTVDALYSGKMKDSDLKRALQNSVGMDFDKIKELAKTDKEGAVKYVNEMLAKAKIASKAIEKSWGGVTSNFINAWTDIQAELQKPLFDSMKEEIQNAGDYLKEHKDEIVGFITGVKDAIKETLPLIGKLATAYGLLRGSMMLGAGIKSMMALRKASSLARLGVIGVIGAFVASRDDVSSFGQAIEKLGAYFEVGFETINFMVSATMESVVGWFQHAKVRGVAYWELMLGYIIKSTAGFNKSVVEILNKAIIEPFNKAVFKAKQYWNDFMSFLGLESEKPILTTSNFISVDGLEETIKYGENLMKDAEKRLAKPVEKTDLENDIAKYRTESNLKLLDLIDKANGKAVANSKKTIEQVKKQVNDATKIDFAPAVGGDGEDGKTKKERLKEALTQIDESMNRMDSLLSSQIKLAESGNDWANSLTGVAKNIDGISKAITRMSVLNMKYTKADLKLQKNYAKAYLKADGDVLKQKMLKKNFDEDQSKLKEQYNRAEIDGYANLAGSMSQAFAEGSSGAKAFMAVQQGLSLYNAITAVTGAWASAPFPYNLPAVASTSVAVAGLLAQMGQTFTGDAGGSGGTPPKLEDENKPTSDSMENSLENIENAQYPMLQLTRDMRGYLSVIANSFGAIENSLLRSDKDFAGNFYQGETKAGMFSSKDYSLYGTSLDFESATVAELMSEQLSVERDTIIKKVYDSMFKTKTTYFHNYEDVSNLFAEDIADATRSLFGGFNAIGEAIGINIDGMMNEVIDIGKIDTTGKTSQEIAQEIEARFSAQTDAIAEKYLGVVSEFQKAGEGLAETAFRVAMTFDQVSHSMELIGKSVDWRTANIIEQVAGGLDMFNASMGSYTSNFFTEEEQYTMKLNTMTKSFASLGLAIPASNTEFRNLVEGIDTTTDAGATLFAEVISLADGFAEMTSSAGSLGVSIEEMIKNVSDAWLGNLSYLTMQQKADFASATFALARQSNGTIDPVESAKAMAETALKVSTTKEDYIPYFNQYIQAIKDQAPEATTDDVVAKLNDILTAIEDGSYQAPLDNTYYEGVRA